MALSLIKAKQYIKNKNISDDDLQLLLEQFYSLAEIVADTVFNRGSKNLSKGIETKS